MMINFSVFLTTLCMFRFCESYKLLVVFPVPGKSHSILGDSFVKILLNAGHEVTYITPMPIKDAAPRLRQINVESNYNYFVAEEVLNIQRLLNKEIDMKDMPTVFALMFGIANATIHHEDVQKLIHNPSEKFDAVIAEWMYSELYSGFSAVFACPLIWFLSVSPHNMALSLIDTDPNPAYTADHIKSNSIPPFTFWERANELGMLVHWKLHKWWEDNRNSKSFDLAFKSAVLKRGHTLLPLDEQKYNGSLMFGNSHISTGDAIPLPRSFIEIGGYHINDTVEPLPEHGFYAQKQQNAGTDKKGILKILGQLKQTVIWKFEETLSDKPKNVHFVNWSPQQSILAHPNCVLFITHGGLLSATEALHYGVPIIGIPMFADQFLNINRAVAKGLAKRVDLNYETPDNLKSAIDEIIGNSSYRNRVKELSFIYNDRTISPGAEIVRWIHHVIKTRGAPHLRSPALHTSWYQKLFLDLVVLVTFIIVTFLTVVRRSFTRANSTVGFSKKCS